jgi:hypothetical protein
MNVYRVPVEAVESVWIRVESVFQKALSKHEAEFSISDLKQLVLDDKWKLFAFIDENDMLDGAAVVSFLTYPKSYVAFVTCIGGKALVNKAYYQKFMDVLKSFGADRVQGYVDDGMERLYKKIGVVRRTTMVEIKL